MSEQEIINSFHNLYYEKGKQGKTWNDTYWMGVQTKKLPLDLWIYQEILYQVRPDIIIECGTFVGGSALFLAHMCDLLKCGEVISIDVEERKNLPQHSRVTYLTGLSVSKEVIDQISGRIKAHHKVLVILDSDHARDYVILELRAYAPMVTIGSYLIVEDTNINGHPACIEHGPGPTEAIALFMKEDRRFIVDSSVEKLLLTFNPAGYLKRIT